MLEFTRNKINTLLLASSLLVFACSGDEPDGPDPQLPSISIENVEVTETNEDFDAEIKLTLTGENKANVVVRYGTTDGTALSPDDFKAIEDKEIIFSPGITERTITVKIIGDELPEPNESFTINLTNVSNADVSKGSATITIVDNDDVNVNPGGLVIPETGHFSADSYPGMSLAWSDEFDGPNIDMTNWTFEVGGGGWGNNELQYYTNGDNAYIEEGNLIIEAKREFIGGREYSSSRMITKEKREFQYGRVDIRAAVPTGKGCWPALWMLGQNFSGENGVGWPYCGEIDIMELVGHEPNKVLGTVHWDDSTNGWVKYGGETTLSSGTFSDEFHVFTITWDSQKIRWYMNDVQYHVININGSELTEFHQNFYFIFNVAVGGNLPGSPDATTNFPQKMIVDYVRVFQ